MATKKSFTIPTLFISLLVLLGASTPIITKGGFDTATYISLGIMILAGALSSLFAKLYINLFVESGIISAVGGLIFGCSCSAFEIMKSGKIGGFVFLPLCLFFLEKLMAENKKGFFALAFSLTLISFASSGAYLIAFLMLYIILRAKTSDWQLSGSKIACLVIELVLGGCLAAFILQPVFHFILAKELPSYILFHSDGSVYFSLVSSLFAPLTVTAYLPFFSLVGVLAFVFTKKEHWLKSIFAFCVVVSLVPFLKNLLTNNGFSSIYIAIPLLMGALATSIAVDSPETHSITKAWFVSFFITSACLYGYYKYLYISFDNIQMSLNDINFIFLLIVAISFISLAFCAALLIGAKPTTAYKVSLLCATALITTISVVFMNLVGNGFIAKATLDNVVLNNLSIKGIVVSGVALVALAVYWILSAVKAKKDASITAFGAKPFDNEEGEQDKSDLETYLQSAPIDTEE